MTNAFSSEETVVLFSQNTGGLIFLLLFFISEQS